MVGLEVVVGYLAGWVWRRARHAAGRIEDRVDAAVDARVEQLYELVAGKLDGDAALARMESEAASDVETQPALSERTEQRVRLALEDAVEQDPAFGARLAELLADLARSSAGGSAQGHGVVAGRDIHVHAEGGSVAAGTIEGSVTLGGYPPAPGTGGR